MKQLQSERGDASFLSVVFITLISMITVAVMLNVLSVVMVKNELDAAADQVARQIQITGKVGSETEELIAYLKSGIKADSILFELQTDYTEASGGSSCIQLGTPFYLTVTAQTHLGGFFSFAAFPLTVSSRAAGVSEVYWK